MTTPPCTICCGPGVTVATGHGHSVCSPCFANWLSASDTHCIIYALTSYPCCGVPGGSELLVWLGDLQAKDRERRDPKKEEGDKEKEEEEEEEKEKEKEKEGKEGETPEGGKKGNDVTTPPPPPFKVPEIPPNFISSLSERFSLSLLRKDPNFRFCPNPRCGQGLVLEISTPSLSSPSLSPSASPSTSITSTSTSTSTTTTTPLSLSRSPSTSLCFFECPTCSTSFCNKCSELKSKHHNLSSGDVIPCHLLEELQFGRVFHREDYLTTTTTITNPITIKACPSCNSKIERNDGCDHMTCGICLFEFCWECLEAFDDYDHLCIDVPPPAPTPAPAPAPAPATAPAPSTTTATTSAGEAMEEEEDEELRMAMELSLQAKKAAEKPAATPGASSTSASPSSDISQAINDPNFMQSLFASLPNVDPNDPNILNVLQSLRSDKKEEKPDDKKDKK
eukprot:TRINITY_DN1446_c0_g1_i6.p1 TRINITY_DN1446_c0_g1~~TRINITY_DN1446_c0_g1_i6.p1  ORF type:complete len:450 (-),score=155.19 TRINITY_DN1446_c0_g1_i6:209-1558(-)